MAFLLSFASFSWAQEGTNKIGSQQDKVLKINLVSFEEEHFSRRSRYFIELMTLALNKSGEPYELNSVMLEPHTEKRSVAFLKSGTYDIHWLNTRPLYEKDLLPIRIPLFKGLIGLRLLLIRKLQIDKFSNIKTIEELQSLITLQGDDWEDTHILENNGFTLKTSTTFANLFRMLSHNRGDFFPRSIAEIWEELETYPNLDLAVDQNIALYYPAAYYYFVAKENTRLKNVIEKGLNIAIADGSFDEVFMRYFGEVIQRANLKNRTIFSLNNANIPANTPFDREELWFITDIF